MSLLNLRVCCRGVDYSALINFYIAQSSCQLVNQTFSSSVSYFVKRIYISFAQVPVFLASGYENPATFSFSPRFAVTRSSDCSPVFSYDITSCSTNVWEGRKRIVASLPVFCQFAHLLEGSQEMGYTVRKVCLQGGDWHSYSVELPTFVFDCDTV
jgi:hypothetical protein